MKKKKSFSKEQKHLDAKSLVAYLDGKITSQTKRHLNKCKECQRVVRGAELQRQGHC